MKEEYLEIEEIDYNTQFDEQPHQNDPAQQISNSMEFPLTHATDFDGQYDDAMLRKLLKKFQMSFLYPFLKGKLNNHFNGCLVLIFYHANCRIQTFL